MIGRVLLAALLAGIAAGLLMGVIQHVRLTPLIIEAERYETAGAHEHAEGTSAHDHEHAEGWAPEDGFERTFYTTVTAIVSGAAFAAMLAGIAIMLGKAITPANGALWGLAGFLAAHLAPAAGLPPELPGMPAADLAARQLWWLGTIAATGAGLALFAFRRETWAYGAAALLIALPHIIGAPQPGVHDSAVPPGLAALFAGNALAANALFWAALGATLGFSLNRFAKEAIDGL